MAPSKSRIERVAESNRAVGWMADNELLRSRAAEGWNPVRYRFGRGGLTITFQQEVVKGASDWTYDCNQELGTFDITRTLDSYMKDKQLELIFCFRSGTGSSMRDGSYLRFFSRRPAIRTGNPQSYWEHQTVSVDGRARATLPGGWKYVASFNSFLNDGTKAAIYKRMVP